MKSIEQLVEAKAKALSGTGEPRPRIVVGMGTCGISAGAQKIMKIIADDLASRGLGDQVEIQPTGCIGLCKREPLVEVHLPGRPGVVYGDVSPEAAREIVQSHVVDGRVAARWVVAAY